MTNDLERPGDPVLPIDPVRLRGSAVGPVDMGGFEMIHLDELMPEDVRERMRTRHAERAPSEPGWYWATWSTAFVDGARRGVVYLQKNGQVLNGEILTMADSFSDWSARIPDPGPGGMLLVTKEVPGMLLEEYQMDDRC